MAEGRMLSKRVTRSNKIATLSSDTARMIYSWLIPYTDVEGRMEADPRLLKADIAPLLDHITPEVINSVLQELHDIGLIILYTAVGEVKQYLEITRFGENQKNLRKDREAPSKIPAPGMEQVRSRSGVGPAELPPKIKRSLREDNIRPADAPFILPSKEEIQESSDPKIEEYIQQVCTRLYEEKIFPEVHAFKNKAIKKKSNGRGVLHVLTRCYIAKPKDPWGYCQKIIAVEDGNYNARDYEKTTQ
jgi:hypothetical protein